ncbi:hypothetical protein DFP72DRAFT_1091443 [Ephemerocybe angulata]|uniref:Uncharacterized protein n=1 Tax=Ephemerocybe angulata TaxID=980116 RepID=A0A8H6HGK6_9AGAR|nr:hypothetical protein DFP72DRAFT_1091443 [Tulosesus angulatus]
MAASKPCLVSRSQPDEIRAARYFALLSFNPELKHHRRDLTYNCVYLSTQKRCLQYHFANGWRSARQCAFVDASQRGFPRQLIRPWAFFNCATHSDFRYIVSSVNTATLAFPKTSSLYHACSAGDPSSGGHMAPSQPTPPSHEHQDKAQSPAPSLWRPYQRRVLTFGILLGFTERYLGMVRLESAGRPSNRKWPQLESQASAVLLCGHVWAVLPLGPIEVLFPSRETARPMASLNRRNVPRRILYNCLWSFRVRCPSRYGGPMFRAPARSAAPGRVRPADRLRLGPLTVLGCQVRLLPAGNAEGLGGNIEHGNLGDNPEENKRLSEHEWRIL